MVGLLGALTPEEQYGEGLLAPMQRGHGLGLLGGIRQLMGPSVMSRMQEANTVQQARLASGERSPTPLTEENMWLADDVAGGLLGPMALALGAGGGMAESIAKLLREGRAAEVTDEMLGALGPNDQRRLFELYESGATGMDLPMDEASRMGRAGDRVNALHGGPGSFDWDVTGRRGSIQQFEPGPEGASFFTDDPSLATQYANRGQEPRPAIYPVKLDNSSFINLDAADKPLMNNDIFSAISDMGASGAVVQNAEDFTPGFRGNPSAVFVAKDPANIRSRFARFDPRLKHNANLLASLAGAGLLGSLAYQPDEAP